ncbi:hypothetical protein DFH05DRAFT_532940 [Lentinula detonsa]|uniref:Arrestin-like N-terminal domain-containing protein n=1 Tax=Lentinula detonsa TaxID=2804962 RepID=A0A9W8NR68_9AGAR|nr:hypothetical protein DFH05DRAFT_532940 [Lentinula detonsa]
MDNTIILPPGYDATITSGNNRDADLPAYSSLSSMGQVVPQNLTELSEGAPSKQFSYHISLKGNNSSASLVLYGNASLSKHSPAFLGGSRVNGLVKVNVESGESINAVVISIQGKIISGSKQHIFLEYTQTLWSSSSDYPKSDGRLQGEHNWPFKLHFPKEVTLTVGTKDAPRVEVFQLPQSFMERHAKASIQYEVIARFARGMLKTDHRIIAPFVYIPIIRPEPPSQLRSDAYERNTTIPGPIADPTGWHTLTPVQIQGKLFTRQATISCILSLALPLSYTRGSIIPLHLVIQSNDPQALETLSSPHAIICRLRRILRYYPDENKTVDPKLRREELEHSELATWWPFVEYPSLEESSFQRTLSGEIILSPELMPTTTIGRFQLEYSVVLFPFDANSFHSENNDILSDCAVEIATAFPPGPRQRTNVQTAIPDRLRHAFQ